MLRRTVLLLLLAGCPSSRPPAAGDAAPRAAMKLRLIPAPAQPAVIEQLVTQQVAKSKAEGRTLLVYAGAAWCEPCRRFHHAAEAGQLDAQFGDLDLLVFDVDVDNERLAYGNYDTNMIPLLALPGPDGKSSARFMAGSIKGEGAVAEMTPRLKALLGR